MIPAILSRLAILSLGYLYPAFKSFAAIRERNPRQYVRWMMYWVVFALFCAAESFADVLVAFWCPLYQDLKILAVVWFLCPPPHGSSYVYRHLVHPLFVERAPDLERILAQIRRQGALFVVDLGSRYLLAAFDSIDSP